MGPFLRRLLKVLLSLTLLGVIGLYVIVNHSELRQELVCKGYWKAAPNQIETAYVQLNEYRWWVRLWSNNRGNANVQTDKRPMSEYFSDVRRVHEGRLAMYSFHDYDSHPRPFSLRFNLAHRDDDPDYAVLLPG
jgi:hypothetical protein